MKYHKLTENAAKPSGFWGKMMIKAMNKGHSSLTDWGLSYIDIPLNSTLLDVGCGGGRTVSKLCRMVGNGKVYGIDYSELCVSKSKKLNQKKKYYVRIRCVKKKDGISYYSKWSKKKTV